MFRHPALKHIVLAFPQILAPFLAPFQTTLIPKTPLFSPPPLVFGHLISSRALGFANSTHAAGVTMNNPAVLLAAGADGVPPEQRGYGAQQPVLGDGAPQARSRRRAFFFVLRL